MADIVFYQMPEIGASEAFTFDTDVIQTITTETRKARRPYPRISARYNYFLKSIPEYESVLAFYLASQVRKIGLPLWSLAYNVGEVSLGQTETTVSQADAIYKAGQKAIFCGQENYSIVDIASVSGETVTHTATGQEHGEAYLAPYIEGYSINGLNVTRGASGYDVLSVTVESDTVLDIAENTFYNGNLTIFTLRPDGSQSVDTTAQADDFRTNIGLIKQLETRSKDYSTASGSYSVFTWADKLRLLRFLFWTKGKEKAFRVRNYAGNDGQENGLQTVRIDQDRFELGLGAGDIATVGLRLYRGINA